MLIDYKQFNNKIQYSYLNNNKCVLEEILLTNNDKFVWDYSKQKTEYTNWDSQYLKKKQTKKELDIFRTMELIWEDINNKDINIKEYKLTKYFFNVSFIKNKVASISFINNDSIILLFHKDLKDDTLVSIKNNTLLEISNIIPNHNYKVVLKHFNSETTLIYNFLTKIAYKVNNLIFWGEDNMYNKFIKRINANEHNISLCSITNSHTKGNPDHKLLIDYHSTFINNDSVIKIKENTKLPNLCEQFFNHKIYRNKNYKSNLVDFFSDQLVDLIILNEIEKKYKLCDISFYKSIQTKTPYIHISFPTKIGEYIMSYGFWKENKHIYFDKDYLNKTNKNGKGGHTFIKKSGKFNNVLYFDFKSNYPNILKSFNISPETFNGTDFDGSTSVLKSKLIELTDLREICKNNINKFNNINKQIDNEIEYRYKYDKFNNEKFTKFDDTKLQNLKIKCELNVIENKNKSDSLKQTANELYGCFWTKYYYFYNSDIAKYITAKGRELIQYANRCLNFYFTNKIFLDEELLETHGIEFNNIDKIKKMELVLYNDTDSALISFDPLFQSSNYTNPNEFINIIYKNSLAPFLIKCLDKYSRKYNIDNFFTLELENIIDKLILISKKQYIQKIGDDINITGYKAIHSSTPTFCRTKLNDTIQYILSDEYEYEELVNNIKEIRKEFKYQPIEKISENYKVSSLDKWILNDQTEIVMKSGADDLHKSVALYNYIIKNKDNKLKYEQIHSNEKVRMYITTDEQTFSYKPYKYPYEYAPDINYEKQFGKTFLNPLNSLLQILNYNNINNQNIVI